MIFKTPFGTPASWANRVKIYDDNVMSSYVQCNNLMEGCSYHSSSSIFLGWFHNIRISTCNTQRKHPQWNHSFANMNKRYCTNIHPCDKIIPGKLKGQTPAHTPNGCRYEYVSNEDAKLPNVSPIISVPTLHAVSTTSEHNNYEFKS